MLHSRYLMLAACIAILAGAIAGCGEDDPVAGEPPVSVDVFFDFSVGGQPLLLNQLTYDNPAGRKYSIKVMRFVLSDITLHSEQGNHVKLRDMHYFNLADPSSQTIHFEGGVPHADWNRVTFTFGLDETRNLRDQYLSMTRFHTEMAWPTSLGEDLGYHYMQLEGNYEVTPGGATAGYTTHSGPRQLDGTNPDYPGVVDATPHHFHFDVDLPFTATHIHDGGTGEVTLHVELNGWYTDHVPADGNDTEYDFTDYPAMIMGNLEAQARLQSNGPFCFAASMESHGGTHH
jgi:hypothetical protein